MNVPVTLAKLVGQLNGAAGRLIVPAMQDSVIREAKEMILKVSSELDDVINEMEQQEDLPTRLEGSD